MAGTTDPRAAGFDAAAFRSGIELAMQMGAPDALTERVTFVFTAKNNFAQEDPVGVPYDLTAAPVSTVGTDREVIVPVAMEFISRSSQARDTSLGYMLPSHVEIYIMDTHYDEVKDADHLLIDGNVYEIQAWLPPVGLFDFTLYSLLAEARDES